jgi:hypothetical protein
MPKYKTETQKTESSTKTIKRFPFSLHQSTTNRIGGVTRVR